MRHVLALAVALLTVASTASAASVSWEFSGVVTGYGSPSPLNDAAPVGSPVLLLLTFDTLTPDSCAQPGSGWYSMTGLNVQLNGITYDLNQAAMEVNNPDGNCAAPYPGTGYTVRGFNSIPPSPTPLVNSAIIGWAAHLEDETIPGAPPADGYFQLGYLARGANVLGTFDSVHAVPEPSSLLLLTTAAPFVVNAVRRRRRG